MGIMEIGHSFLFAVNELRYQFVIKNNIQPTGVLICPQDLKMLIKFNRIATGRVVEDKSQLTLYGLKVYRSEDLKIGEIKLLVD